LTGALPNLGSRAVWRYHAAIRAAVNPVGAANRTDTMRSVMLYLDESIERYVRELTKVVGYPFTSTHNPAEAFRAIEAGDTECVVLTDNFTVNPVIHDALTTLRDNPALHDMAWVIGPDVQNPLTQVFLDQGLLDDYLLTPFTIEEFLAVMDRAFDVVEYAHFRTSVAVQSRQVN
jgi:hypothetical protein